MRCDLTSRDGCVHGQLALSTELAVECNLRAKPSGKCALALRVDSLLVGSTEPADRRRSDVALLPGVSKDASDQPGSRLVDHPQKQSPFRVETRGDGSRISPEEYIFYSLWSRYSSLGAKIRCLLVVFIPLAVTSAKKKETAHP